MFLRLATYTLTISLVGLTCSAQRKDDSPSGSDPGTCSNLPGYSALQAALASATSAETSGLNNHMWATIVDRDGRLRCGVFGRQPRRAMAGKPRHLGAEGQHRQFIQPGFLIGQQRLRTARRTGALDRESLLGRATRREPVRIAVQQSCGYERRVQAALQELWHAE